MATYTIDVFENGFMAKRLDSRPEYRRADAATFAFRREVFAHTSSQAMRDVPAGWIAHHDALGKCASFEARNVDAIEVRIGRRTVHLERLS